MNAIDTTREDKIARNNELADAMRAAAAANNPRTVHEWCSEYEVSDFTVYSIARRKRLHAALKRPAWRRRETPTVQPNDNGAGDVSDKVFFRIGKTELADAGLIGVPIAVTVANGCIVLSRKPEPFQEK